MKTVTLDVSITRLGSNDYAVEFTGSLMKNGKLKSSNSSIVTLCDSVQSYVDDVWSSIPWHELILGNRPNIDITYNGFKANLDSQREESFLQRYFTERQQALSDHIGRFV